MHSSLFCGRSRARPTGAAITRLAGPVKSTLTVTMLVSLASLSGPQLAIAAGLGLATPSELHQQLESPADSEALANNRACGLYCLAYLILLRSEPVALSELAALVPVGEQGCSIADMCDAALTMGLDAEVIRCRPDALQRLSLPAIAHLEPTNLSLHAHFIVLLELGPESVRYFDWTTRTISTTDRNAFFSRASGYYLVTRDYRPSVWNAVLSGAIAATSTIATAILLFGARRRRIQ